jgi:processive 1,2-diacylglycerol beta-glucosyltransferase
MSGGAGIGSIHKLARRLLEIPTQDFQLIALAGRSTRLVEEFRELAEAYPGKLIAMGYTETIERVMAVSDLAITKSGGLTTSECLAMGLPLVLVSPIPGQEERNADYLLEHGVALKAYDIAGGEFRVRLLLRDRTRLNTMRENALRLGRPHAAQDILRLVTQGKYD